MPLGMGRDSALFHNQISGGAGLGGNSEGLGEVSCRAGGGDIRAAEALRRANVSQ